MAAIKTVTLKFPQKLFDSLEGQRKQLGLHNHSEIITAALKRIERMENPIMPTVQLTGKLVEFPADIRSDLLAGTDNAFIASACTSLLEGMNKGHRIQLGAVDTKVRK